MAKDTDREYRKEHAEMEAGVIYLPIFHLPMLNLPMFNQPMFSLPMFNQPMFSLPMFNLPKFNLPMFNHPLFSPSGTGSASADRRLTHISQNKYTPISTICQAGKSGQRTTAMLGLRTQHYVGGREPYNPSEHQPISHDRALTGTPLQPKPLRSNQFKDSSSDCSLVKRFTEVAKRSEVPGSPNPEPEELPRVPEIRAPPKVPSWRADTPPPIIVEDRARSLAPRLRDRVPLATPLRTAPATAPPPRTAGIRAPTGVYREQGVASASFAERVGRRGSQLVLFRTPSPTFSCAVQSCFCTAEDTDDRVCPSCCARRRLERDLQMQWI
ncbi:hypothetical protein GGR54DRAFT_639985 [Hypoxylon sp. NC1633]|nr:hypothetical protein GGR54DRAFT_639985 [Hypoxylon sp. NC1633]